MTATCATVRMSVSITSAVIFIASRNPCHAGTKVLRAVEVLVVLMRQVQWFCQLNYDVIIPSESVLKFFWNDILMWSDNYPHEVENMCGKCYYFT